MTRRGLCSSSFGISRRGKMSIAQALYASAAFPAVFPPLRIRSEKFDFSGGAEDEPPAWLYLADGGVFNNLATEVSGPLAISAEDKYLVKPAGNMVPAVQRNFVINASAPPSTRRLGIFKLPRTMSVMYESTVRPRIERLMEQESLGDGPIVIDVAEVRDRACPTNFIGKMFERYSDWQTRSRVDGKSSSNSYRCTVENSG